MQNKIDTRHEVLQYIRTQDDDVDDRQAEHTNAVSGNGGSYVVCGV